MDKNKLELTFIYKNGCERNISVNLFNVKWVCDKILGRSSNGCRYVFSDKLSFIYLKNFSFSCNCSFDFDKDFRIRFSAIDCGKVTVKGRGNYYGFNIFADECYLDNIKNLEQFRVVGKNLVISNSDLVFGRKKIDGISIVSGGGIDVEDLVLNNVSINNFNDNFEGKINILSGSNYEVKFTKMISINGKRYFNKTDNDSIIILSDDKVINGRMDLISVLKGYREYLEDIIDEVVWKDLSIYNQILASQEKILEIEEKKLWFLKNEINNKALENRKKLCRSKCYEIVGKN